MRDFDAGRSSLRVLREAPEGRSATQTSTSPCGRGELERLGYLQREPHPDDRRSKRIVLTQRGVAAVGVIRDAVAEMEAAWEQRLGPKRFAVLRNLLLELQQPA